MHICYKILKKTFYYAKNRWIKFYYLIKRVKKNINHEFYLLNRKNRKASVVIYCCITDGYDSLIKHTKINWDWDYICFTDNPALYNQKYFGAWEVVPTLHKETSPHLTNRFYKFKPHVVCADYNYAIYIDGNIDVISNSFFETYSEHISNSVDLALISHPERSCVYDEVDACARLQKDSEENIARILSFFEGINFPKHFGLSANGIIFSCINSNAVTLLLDETFEFVKTTSKRDQIALAYILWKHDFAPKYLESVFLSECVKISEHVVVTSIHEKRYGSDYKDTLKAILTSQDNPMLIFLRNLEKGKSVLEFGPSWGYYTQFLKMEKRCNISICELNRNAFLDAMHYADDGICEDIEELRWVDHFKDKKFDYIFFLDILEHLKNPCEQIKYAESFLSKDGMIIISLPNIAYNGVLKMLLDDRFTYNQFGILDGTHLRFFAYKELAKLVSKTSLSIKSISFIYRNEVDSYIDCALHGWQKIFAPLFMLRKYGKVFQFFMIIEKSNNAR